ncbi:hypothetical protein ACFQ5F_04225 [Kroppenstedtia eburnea]|uniref:hypothetical protein n=1 Tax=Kroppenstedtia eburnea TaxID=714067 RepID=UPI003626C01F
MRQSRGTGSSGGGDGKEPKVNKVKDGGDQNPPKGNSSNGSKISSDYSIRTYRQLDLGELDEVLKMDKRLVVEMPFEGQGKSNVNAEGWLRNADYYWDEIVKRYPEALSQKNLDILNGKYEFRTPLNDKQFRSIFTQYDVSGLRGHPLIHHHIGGGGQAVAVPKPLHNGFGGIHNAEKKIGIWGKDKPYSDMLQRMLESLENGGRK